MKNILLGLLLSFNFTFATVDINHASFNELLTLKGIGKIKAQNILNHIKQYGCFKSIEHLEVIKGIGKKTILKNKDLIKITPCDKTKNK